MVGFENPLPDSMDEVLRFSVMETSFHTQLFLSTQSWFRQTGPIFALMLLAGLAVTIVGIIPGARFSSLILTAGLRVISLSSSRGLFYFILASTLLLPPYYPAFLGGSIPIFLPSLLLMTTIPLQLWRTKEFPWKWDSLEKTAAIFLATAAFSLPFSFWFSGRSQGIQCCLRFLLLLQPFVFFLWVRGKGLFPDRDAKDKTIFFILLLGGLAAGYGIYDFYFPVSHPHPFASQYIYLWGKLIRRAQGLLYESSNFGNLCAFLLSLSLCFLVSQWQRLPIFRKGALFLLAGVFSAALFLAYSRGSWANFLAVIFVFFCLERKVSFKRIFYALLPIAGFLGTIYFISPSIFMNFFDWRLWSMLQFWNDPNFASSGRWNNWVFLASSFAQHPERLIFGVGYKSLATTSLFGKKVVADNAYLSAALETGLIGLLAFLSFQVVLLRFLYKKMRADSTPNQNHQRTKAPKNAEPAKSDLEEENFPVAKAVPTLQARVEGRDISPSVSSLVDTRSSLIPIFYAQFMFAFWIGEMVQMFTGDIFTYWRNLILFFTVLAMAITPQSEHGTTNE